MYIHSYAIFNINVCISHIFVWLTQNDINDKI